MAIQIQLRQGTTTEHNTFTGAVGEVTVDTTNKTLRVHDGSTVGGTRLATLTGGLVPTTQLPAATTSVQGAVILNNTVTSTSATQALTAAQGKVLNDTMFGVNQTTQNMTSSRIINTTYTNSTGRPIFVFITTYDLPANAQVILDGEGSGDIDSVLVMNQWVSFMVRVGGTYRIDVPTNLTLNKWLETR